MAKVKIQITKKRQIAGKQRKEFFTMVTGQTPKDITANDIDTALRRGELRAVAIDKDEPGKDPDSGDDDKDKDPDSKDDKK